MRPIFFSIMIFACTGPTAGWCAETPPLLAKALAQWSAGAGDLALTQRTRILHDDGTVKEERIERYDPSLPDHQRWRLLSIDGQPATDEQRKKWEERKNGKPRKKAVKALTEYLDLENSVLLNETPLNARFEVAVRPETSRLLDVEKVAVVVTVEKKHGTVAHIAATLREPIRVLLGIAKITDFDLDVGFDPPPPNANTAQAAGQVNTGSTARATMSKFGDPTEYLWSDFKRVTAYARAKEASPPNATKP